MKNLFIKNLTAVFFKQARSLVYMPVYLGMAIAFLVLGLVIALVAGEHPSITTGTFLSFIVGMQLVMETNRLIAEDKSTMNLRFMAMAGVKPSEYSVGLFAAVMAVSFVIMLAFALVGGHWGVPTLIFMGIAMAGAIVSAMLGLMLGLSKMPALTTPVALILGIAPMFADANETLEPIFRFAFTVQLRNALDYMAHHPEEEIIYHVCQNCGEYVLCIEENGYEIAAATGVIGEFFIVTGITGALILALLIFMNVKYGLKG